MLGVIRLRPERYLTWVSVFSAATRTVRGIGANPSSRVSAPGVSDPPAELPGSRVICCKESHSADA
jgi:hypothetical protein